MKPDFALSLSMEGITLLCRAETGWHLLGDVPLDHRDLGAALADLRAEGEALVDGPAACKLILPNDQIKYLHVPATEEDAEAQVAAALTGATPYDVAELSYDFTEIDDVFQVAAVAIETLREAEAFAVEHGFAPVSFVAIPVGDDFEGEPFFGATGVAGQFLGPDEYPEPDLLAVDVSGAGAPFDFQPLYSTPAVPEEAPSFASRRRPNPDAPLEPLTPIAEPIAPASPSVTQDTIVAPSPPPPDPSSLSNQTPRFDPATLAAGLKAPPRGAMTPALEVVNPAPKVRPDSYVGVTAQPMADLPRHKQISLYLIAFFVVLLAAAVTWAALFTEDGVATLWQGGEETTQVAALPDPTVDTQPLAPVSPETITDSAEIEAMEDDGTYDPVEAAIEPSLEAEARYAATGIWDFAPRQPSLPVTEGTEGIYVGSFEVSQQTHDAIALPSIESLTNDVALPVQYNPLPAGTILEFDDRGLVVATREGALTPEWITVFAGKPAVVPASFPTRTVAPTPAPEEATQDPALLQLASVRPQPRPGDLVEQNERATLGGSTLSELAGLRPRLRPEDPALEAAAAVVASIDPSDLEGATALAIPSSLRPALRPNGFEAKAAKVQEQLAAVAVPPAQVTTPSIPSSASVARSATQTNAINLRKINLIGVYGTTSDRRALVRLSTGRYRKVKVGDRLDGGRVSAIGESELRYVKGSRSIVLALPKG